MNCFVFLLFYSYYTCLITLTVTALCELFFDLCKKEFELCLQTV
jgi:hypothetical protein